MRYRALSPDGDYTFGQGAANFLVNTPQTVGQAILTRLKLLTQEWFLDVTDGTGYNPLILGKNTQSTRDLEIKSRILRTPGVKQLVSYASQVQDRGFSVQAVVDTIYGQITIVEPL